MTFPVYLRFGGITIPPHPFFECIAYAAAFCVYLVLRKRTGDVLSGDMRWWVIAAAAVGAAGGSKLIGVLENPQAFWGSPGWGKTVVGGLVGGFDVRSVKKSCIHIAHPDGRLIPFDTYNLSYRDELESTREESSFRRSSCRIAQ